MRSATAISANYLEKLADPECRFHADYLAYKDGQISHAELLARLPHVAMVGDSVTRNVYISSKLSTFWRARTRYGNDWFLNVDPSPESIYSVFERLQEFTPLVATQCGGLGAMVDEEGQRQNFFRKILRTHDFSGQVGCLLSSKGFPDLILICIGHNNVDWAWRCPAVEFEQPERHLRSCSARFREDYERQLQRLIGRARTEQHRVAMVVYGLINFESYFKGREMAERLRAADPSLYPHLETTYKYFTSFRPAYRANLIRLAAMVNEELRAMVNELDRDLGADANLQVRYSDALATADLSRAELLHAIDGWHASIEGHNVLAEAAFKDLGPSLEFLGINSSR